MLDEVQIKAEKFIMCSSQGRNYLNCTSLVQLNRPNKTLNEACMKILYQHTKRNFVICKRELMDVDG